MITLLWVSGILAYLGIGFTTFKTLYAVRRSRLLVTLEKATKRRNLAHAKFNQIDKASRSMYSTAWQNADRERDLANKAYQDAVDSKRTNDPLATIFAIPGWPLLALAYAFIQGYKFVKWLMFRGDMDRGAKRRAEKILAPWREEQERKEVEAKLVEVAKKEGLL